MSKFSIIILLILLSISSNAQQTISYWFDQQTERKAYENGTIDCSSLPTGVHAVHFQITNADGNVSPVRSQIFLFFEESESGQATACYWFDQQTKRTAYTGGMIDCSSLPIGTHAVHFQLTDENGFVSPTQTQIFLKLEDDVNKFCYWFDNLTYRNIMSTDETEISVEHLSNGVHTIHAMLVDDNANAINTTVISKQFVIVCNETEHVDDNHDGLCDVCGEHLIVTGINSHSIEKGEDGPMYNLSGMRISRPTKGIVIIKGKKILSK